MGAVRNLLRGIGTIVSCLRDPSLNLRAAISCGFLFALRGAWRCRCVARHCHTRDAGGMAKHASTSEQLAVRIEPALRAALEAAAASDRRPVSQYVRNLILDAVDGERERQGERVSR